MFSREANRVSRCETVGYERAAGSLTHWLSPYACEVSVIGSPRGRTTSANSCIHSGCPVSGPASGSLGSSASVRDSSWPNWAGPYVRLRANTGVPPWTYHGSTLPLTSLYHGIRGYRSGSLPISSAPM